MSHKIKIICAWCKREMGWKHGGKTPGQVTHSICKWCAAEQERRNTQ